MTKGMGSQQAELLLGTYLEGLVSLPWLSPEVIAKARVAFTERATYLGLSDDIISFGPKPPEMRNIIIKVHNQHATDEATRLSGYIEGDWQNRDVDPEARKRSDLRMQLFNEFKELNTFDTPALEQRKEHLAITHAG